MASAKDRKCLNFSNCGTFIYRDNRTGLCRPCLDAKVRMVAPAAQLDVDREKRRLTAELSTLRAKYAEAVDTIERQEKELKTFNVLDAVDTFTVEPKVGSRTSEGTIVVVASDWHLEERVDPKTINGVNEFNLDIAHNRVEKFFQGVLRLTRLHQQDITIKTLVLALLGDFISNDIHEEFSDLTDLQPAHAITFAQNHIISGIQFLLDNSDLELVIPCHSGNHGRTTKTTRFGSENGHSLEYLMYLHLAAYFRNESRVKFIISDGMHSYMDVYGTTLRFHHGHAVKYNGGVGGIYIPVLKAIAQWDKTKHADLDVFGHFHQLRDGGKFMCNGSLIGFNAFALSIKADYEQPQQWLFLIDKKRGRTARWPILLS